MSAAGGSAGDRVLIEGLQVEVVVGVYDYEREAAQPLLLDIELAYDNLRAAESDDVADTIDYAAVCEVTRAFIAQREPQLLETLAEALAGQLLLSFDTPRVRIRIRKPLAAQALGAAAVGIEIIRGHGMHGHGVRDAGG